MTETPAKYDTAIPLGRGGMGEVLKAWDPNLGRWVALKFLRGSDPEDVERLQREARAQAQVDHPNVCRVYEVGETDGRPYIAMQYIEGEPLDEVAARVSLEERIRLLALVADAVHAAHRVGLIHRDLKPANVLVGTDDDGRPVPYVLDFGVAREQEAPGVTRTGWVVGTPGYLSPEQAQGKTSLDRRADVFGLGALLYELLVGRPAFQGDSAIQLLIEVLERDPPSPRRVDASVPRDLATVAMKCLEKEPEKRYDSAREVAEELRRYLDGEPVRARPIGRIGRLARRARRHPAIAGTLIVAAALILVLLGGLAVGAVKYTVDLERERTVAVEARDEAEEVVAFLVDLFRSSDPLESKGEEATARELLERAAERVGEDLAARPAVQGRLLHTIGEVSRNLGLLDEADELLEQAVEVRSSHFGPRSPEAAEAIFELARLRRDQMRLDESIELHRRALEIQREALPEDSLPLAKSLFGLAAALQQGRSDEDPEPLYLRALEIYEREHGRESDRVAMTHNNLALLHSSRGEPERAVESFLRALETFEAVHGRRSAQVASTLHNLGSLLGRRGEPSRARAMLEEAISIRLEVLGGAHAYTSYSYLNLAVLEVEEGDCSAAVPPVEEGLEVARRALGERHLVLAYFHAILGGCRLQLGRPDEAARHFRAGLDFAEDPLHSIALGNRSGLADVALRTGDVARAGELLTGIVADSGSAMPGSSVDAEARLLLAEARRRAGRPAEARELLEELIAEAGKEVEEGDVNALEARRALAAAELDLGNPEAARAVADAAGDPSEAPLSRAAAAGLLEVRGRAALASGGEAEAREHWRRAEELLRPLAARYDDLRYRWRLARVLALLGSTEGARETATPVFEGGWVDPELSAWLSDGGLHPSESR